MRVRLCGVVVGTLLPVVHVVRPVVRGDKCHLGRTRRGGGAFEYSSRPLGGMGDDEDER